MIEEKHKGPVDWIMSCGRYHLTVNGVVVTTEGDLCRDGDIPERSWNGESIKAIAHKAERTYLKAQRPSWSLFRRKK